MSAAHAQFCAPSCAKTTSAAASIRTRTTSPLALLLLLLSVKRGLPALAMRPKKKHKKTNREWIMAEDNGLEATRREALLLGAGGLLALTPFEAPAFAMTGDMAGL